MYQQDMSMQDKDLSTRVSLATRAEQPPRDAAMGGELPLAGKRVAFRYWLAAIVLGAAIWGGIAFALS